MAHTTQENNQSKQDHNELFSAFSDSVDEVKGYAVFDKSFYR
jgi:hypothetical protein